MPNTRTIDYVVLIQDGKGSIQDVPQDVRDDVTKWLGYFQAEKQVNNNNEH